MKKIIVFTICCLFVLADILAQDSLILYNGKQYKGKIVDYNKNETLFRLKILKKNNRKIPHSDTLAKLSLKNPDLQSLFKTKVFKKEDVFAIYYKDSIHQVLYTPLITDEQPLTVEEMGRFIAGENLAQYKYHAPWATAVGAITGVGLFNLGMWGILIPGAYIGVVSVMPTNPKSKKYFPPEKLNDELYIDGFKRVAKQKKLVNAAIGSAASVLLIGTIAAIFTFKNYND